MTPLRLRLRVVPMVLGAAAMSVAAACDEPRASSDCVRVDVVADGALAVRAAATVASVAAGRLELTVADDQGPRVVTYPEELGAPALAAGDPVTLARFSPGSTANEHLTFGEGGDPVASVVVEDEGGDPLFFVGAPREPPLFVVDHTRLGLCNEPAEPEAEASDDAIIVAADDGDALLASGDDRDVSIEGLVWRVLVLDAFDNGSGTLVASVLAFRL